MQDARQRDYYQAPQVPTMGQLAWRKFTRDRVGVFALFIATIYFVLALGVWAGVWGNNWDIFVEGRGYAPMSPLYWLGTNFNGQDILARAVYSTKTAFEVGMIVAAFSIFL